jgi:hypothetical protein
MLNNTQKWNSGFPVNFFPNFPFPASGWIEAILTLVTPAKIMNKYCDIICGLLGIYTVSCGNYLPTFRDNVSVPYSRVKIPDSRFLSFLEYWPVKMGPTRCPETSVNNYHTTPCNYPKDHRLYEHRGGSLKSSIVVEFLVCDLISRLHSLTKRIYFI